MATKHNQERYVIAPDYAKTIVCFLSLCIVVFLVFKGDKMYLPQDNVSIFHVILFLCIFLLGCRSYVLDKKGIYVKLLFLPVYKLCWDDISEIIVICERKPARYGNAEGVILIIPHGCKPFLIGQEKVDNYLARHPISVLSVNGPKKRIVDHAAMFQMFFPAITMLESHK